MTPEDSLVFLCTRQNFSAEHRQKVIDVCQRHQIQWDIVCRTAKDHQVLPLVYVNLSSLQGKQIEIPQAPFNELKKSHIHNVIVKKRTAEILSQILALFNEAKLDVMLVKGGALNVLVYEQPWYTISYDVDLVMKTWGNETYTTAHHNIANIIETFNHQPNEFKEHIEYDYYEHHDITMNNVLPIDFERIWREARQIQVDGHDVFVMTPEDMLITAAIQSCRKRFFRLKALCDIASIIEKYPDLNWGVVMSKTQTYKCNTIMYTALLTTQRLLDCPLPENILNDLQVNPVRAALIRHLVDKLYRSFSLTQLFDRSDTTFLGREFSWPLALTYATYRLEHLGPKLGEIHAAWRNPPPPVPG